MTTLSSLNAALVTTVTPSSGTTSLASTVRSSAEATANAESTVVTIPSLSVESPLVYTQQGILANVATTTTWASNPTDAVSMTMAGDYLAGSMSGRFTNLGSALLDQFKTSGSDFSQSVTVGSTGLTGAASLSGQGPQGDIKLTVETASGVKVDIEMDSEDGTLSVSTHSSGTLSDAERSAIANLADGFQKAIDGLGAYPQQLDLSGLTQYDTSVLSSVNMQFNVTGDGASNVSANISLSNSARSVSITNSEGTLKLNVDTSDSALWGSGAQRDQAIASYLAQFDNANAKGHGDAALMSMFKDAFTQMNSDYGTSSKQLPGTTYAPWLAQSDHAMLTGLADFTASISDNATSPNPVLPSQTDNFAYQVSQSTRTEGNLLNGSIAQTQQSHLQASYHQSLAGGAVKLGKSLASQTYDYMQIDDDASSTVNLATQRGNLVQATLDQSSSQSTRKSEYVRGVLVSDVDTPTNNSSSTDLLALLKPLFADQEAEQNSGTWQQALSKIHGMVLLNTNAS
ncbi:hypothetical protein ABH945_006155 [Paraburkholderia sp. GAS333]|uniref:hypothetical protein n=1 Tax=Paraburkholderia sp. GAS333 TaxID=3156279 RepID=UPI003D26231E